MVFAEAECDNDHVDAWFADTDALSTVPPLRVFAVLAEE